jgi:uncharacterized protein with HEPN domain
VKDPRLYLAHAGESISWLEAYASEGKTVFQNDRKTQDAVLRNLQVLAEALRNLTPHYAEQHPEISWKNIAAFRNLIVHEYWGVDLDLVWEILVKDVPDLKEQLKHLE